MIRELRVNNLAIIKDMQIELEENFSVLTGETGAGKSIILDGIAFILGARANTSVIRHNENKLIVEAVISLSSKLVEKLKLDSEVRWHRDKYKKVLNNTETYYKNIEKSIAEKEKKVAEIDTLLSIMN